MHAEASAKLKVLAVAVTLAIGMAAASHDAQAQSQSAESRRYDIPAGNLADCVRQLGMQGNLQLLAPPELTSNLRCQPVAGTYTARQALEYVLAGSGLTYEFVNAGTVVIKSAATPPAAAPGAPSASANSRAVQAAAAEPATLEGVTVTGTRIRGGSTPSPVITIGSEQIAEEGFTDLGEVIRSIPQNFSGGQNPGVSSGGFSGAGAANQNMTGGSGLNLRGLGPDATLTLLNGRRLAYGGFVQAVDISAIPVEAVERIEIIADGASAIYGSDAVGGVGNVILKNDYEGVTVGARYGTATDGGLTTREYNLTAGTTWSSGGLIATYKDVSTDPIYSDRRSYTDFLVSPTTIYPGSDLRSGLLSVHQSIGEHVELRLDALRSKREQYYYYFVGGANSSYIIESEIDATMLAPSINISLPNDWELSAGAAVGEDNIDYTQSRFVVATGLATPLSHLCYCNNSRTYDIGLEGPLFSMPGGDVRLAFGGGYRYNEYQQYSYVTGAKTADGDESSRFVYAEANFPLINPSQNIAGVRRLDATVAVRGEDYDSFGGVTTPKLGLIYGPNADFTLKTSWGKSFKAPTLYQLNWMQSSYLYTAATLGGTGYPADATGLYLFGGNLDLEPEQARAWSASVAFHPEAFPGFESELTFFDIDFSNRVVQAIASSSFSQALSDPIYAQFVENNPTAEQQAEAIAGSTFYNFYGADYDVYSVVALVNGRYINASQQNVRGFDLSGSYRFDVGAGRLTIRGSASWLDSSQQTSSGQSPFELAGTLFNPPKVTGRIGAVWSEGGFSLATFANYKDGVTNTADDKKTASFTTFDSTLRYEASRRNDLLSGFVFELSAQNLFDRAPPLYTPTSSVASAFPYDSTNYSAIGRFVSLSISKHF